MNPAYAANHAKACHISETEDYACRYVLGFGPRMIVLEPETLRERVLATARATLQLIEPASIYSRA